MFYHQQITLLLYLFYFKTLSKAYKRKNNNSSLYQAAALETKSLWLILLHWAHLLATVTQTFMTVKLVLMSAEHT